MEFLTVYFRHMISLDFYEPRKPQIFDAYFKTILGLRKIISIQNLVNMEEYGTIYRTATYIYRVLRHKEYLSRGLHLQPL